LLLFGAIVYPGGRVPTRGAEIAVVVKGPAQSLIVREKQKIAGIWLNADSARFRSVPSFYAVAASQPIEKLVDPRTAAIYELGSRTSSSRPPAAHRPRNSAASNRASST
jgi:hypothetical protein